MDDNLQKLEIGLIAKLVGAISIDGFRKLLTKNIIEVFTLSHKNTNEEFGFRQTAVDPRAIDYLRERTIVLSDKTAAKLEGDLKFELIEALKNNEPIGQITKRLDKIFTDMMPWQLERIARTETLNAMNAGRISAYQQSGAVQYKMWKAAMRNARTAADSKRLNGQIQKLDDPFVDPKTGESFMHPPNRPQCRCAISPLRKLPDNVIRIGGLMYAGDQVVGKLEIDVESLSKNEKRVWIKPTEKKIGHWRKIRTTFSDIKEYSNVLDFMRKNVKELKAHGIKDKQGTEELFNRLRLERFTPVEMPKENAITTIKSKIREGVHTGWFRYEDKGMKIHLFNSIVNSDKTRSAGLKVMLDLYNIQNDSNISFDEFLHKDIILYRGGNVTDDIFTSFSLNRSIAEKFAKQNKVDKITEIKIKPIQTLGSYQTIAEAEVLVPKEILSGTINSKSIKIEKIEIHIDLLKFQQKRKAWCVTYANGHAVQCFEDEKDADYFINTSKKKDAGWFDFGGKTYHEVKPGWDIHKKGARITFEVDGEDVKKLEINTELLNKNKKINSNRSQYDWSVNGGV